MLTANHYYRQRLSDQSQIDMSILFREATIAQHAQLLASSSQTIPSPTIKRQNLMEGIL